MSIFEEMRPLGQFNSWREFTELQRMIVEAISLGFVEEVPVMRSKPVRQTENWYRDTETGIIYSLVPPEPPACGSWEQVPAEDLETSDYRTQ